MVLDLTSNAAKSFCNGTLGETKYPREASLFFIVVVLMPLVTIAIFFLIIRSNHREIHTKMTSSAEKGYENLVGFTPTGITVMIYILSMDILAIASNHIRLSAPAVTIALDFIIMSTSMSFIFYLCCVKLFKSDAGCMKKLTLCYFNLYVLPYLFFLFGTENTRLLRDRLDQSEAVPANVHNQADAKAEKAKKAAAAQEFINVWVIFGVLFFPLLCISSHAGYITMAWITQPVKTTAAFLESLVICFYFFFMFRQCYVVHAKTDLGGKRDQQDATVGNELSDTTAGNELSDITEGNEPSDKTEGCKNCTKLKEVCTKLKEVCMCIILVPSMVLIIHWMMACIFAILLVTSSQINGIWYYFLRGSWRLCRVWRPCCCCCSRPRCFQECSKKFSDWRSDHFPSCSFSNDESEDGSETAELNYECFFTTFSTALLIVAPPLLISLIKIPVSTFVFVEYLEATGQILIVVIGSLVSYKIFSRKETESEMFMKAFKDKTGMASAQDTREGGTTGQHESSDVSDKNMSNKHVLEEGGAIAGRIARKLDDYLDRRMGRMGEGGGGSGMHQQIYL